MDRVRKIEIGEHRFHVNEICGSTDYGPFWRSFADGTWERDTLDLIDRFVGPGDTFYDIGGWIGPTALWAASRGSRVFTFEPDPVAVEALRANLALNADLASLVTLLPTAVGPADGHLDLYSANFGDSETTVFATIERDNKERALTNRITVPMIDINRFISSQGPQLGRSLIKMDIEGGEFTTLPHLHTLVAGYGIPIAVTLHPINITCTNKDALSFIRQQAVMSALSPFIDCHWYLLQDGTVTPLTKTSALGGISRSLARHFTFLITSKPLQTAQMANKAEKTI